jgi:hypothetical protein
MKVRPLGNESFHADGKTANSSFSQIFPKIPTSDLS